MNDVEIMKKINSKVAQKDYDKYPERVENIYHSVKKMNSLGVFQNEEELCNKIIKYKKEKGMDYDTWEEKKNSIKDQKDIIIRSIEDGVLDFETYKKKIQE